MSVRFQRTRTEELHLDEHVNCGTYREGRTKQDARRKCETGIAWPHELIEVVLGPTRSWLSRTAR